MFHFGAGFMKQKAKRTLSYGIRGILDILEVRGQDLQNNHSNLHSVALIVKYFALFIADVGHPFAVSFVFRYGVLYSLL